MSNDKLALKSAGSRFILVVGNKTAELFYSSMLLQRFGYRVCTAHTAGEALDMISVSLPALIVADLDLPGLSGLELLGILRQDPRTASVPVILIRQAGDPTAQRRTLAAGVASIEKPVQAEEFYRAVQAAIEATPRGHIRINTRLAVSVNGRRLDCIEGECASVLSEHGMYVRMLKPFPGKEQLKVEMEIDGRVVSVLAVVLYSHRFGEGPFGEPGMGLKFLQISPGDREFIRRFIREEVIKGITPEKP